MRRHRLNDGEHHGEWRPIARNTAATERRHLNIERWEQNEGG